VDPIFERHTFRACSLATLHSFANDVQDDRATVQTGLIVQQLNLHLADGDN
jgi:hypothetical protein